MNTLMILMNDLARAWQLRAARREFRSLDEGAMRDLGISASEIGSYWAESQGLAERTRRRLDTDIGRP